MNPTLHRILFVSILLIVCHQGISFSLSSGVLRRSKSPHPKPSNHHLCPRLTSNTRRSAPQLKLSLFPLDSAHDVISSVSSLPIAELQENALEALGQDIFTFLAVSVVVVPLCKSLKISPVLGFLAVGCAIGPYGFHLFSNTEADVELGDFGILFLLFNEGLSLSPERIKELGRFTGLGVFQLLISIGLIFVGTFWGGPVILKFAQEANLPLDIPLLKPIVDNPIEAFVIASAGALSSSAFVLPVLEQKMWKEKPEGIAGLSILLLQDLAVAPLLVILPLLAGSGPSTAIDLGLLVAKATVGFGVVLVAGSYVLRYVFDVVAAARSTETFVAAALLVAVGMGQTADFLGLSASTGAFAAGVLLAGNKYRPQIQADIKPFEGILLGIFFITAGANLDPQFVVQELSTLVPGVLVFIAVKATIIYASGPTLGLTKGQAARVALTLAGGGEFAFVLFQLAQDLEVLPFTLAKLLTASVILSMSLTPVLGELGAYAGNLIEASTNEVREDGLTVAEESALFDQLDKDQNGVIELDELRDALVKLNFPYISIAAVFKRFDKDGDGMIDRNEWRAGIEAGLLAEALNLGSKDALTETDVTFSKDALVICGFGEVGKSLYNLLEASAESVVCFDMNPSRVTAGVLSGIPVVFGDGAKVDLLKAAGVTKPRAVVVTYASDQRRIDATTRLRSSLPEGTPIYVYEGNNKIRRVLLDAGATEVISETAETVLRIGALLGICKTQDEVSRLRGLSVDSLAMENAVDEAKVLVNELIELAEELGCRQSDLVELWSSFSSIAGDRDVVPVSEMKEMLMRQAGDGPSDGAALEFCLSRQDEDGEGELTFVEYARATWQECPIDFD